MRDAEQAKRTPPGLICAYAFAGDGTAQALRDDEVALALTRDAGWLWLHFQLNDARARDWIGHCQHLPEAARALFLDTDDHPRLDQDEGALFGIFADFQMELDGSSEAFGRLRFACTRTLVISARRQALRSVEKAREALARGAKAGAPVAIIERIVDLYSDGAAGQLAQFTHALDRIEDLVVADRVADERRRLASVRRGGVTLHRQMASTLALLRAFALHPAEGAPELDSEPLVQRLEELARELVSLQDRARLLQEEMSSRLAEETNRSLNRISLMTAAMLPGTLITGLFGMNTGAVPFSQAEGGFWWAFLIAALATVAFFLFLRGTGEGSR